MSLEPISDYPTFETGVIDMVALVGDARVLLFQTWPREPNSPALLDLNLTFEEMWMGLESGYQAAAEASGTEVAPVGAAWVSALQLDPPVDLYTSDGSHPAIAGSFLAGCVFFDMIVGGSCETSSYVPDGLAEDDAARLRMIADMATP